MPPGFTVLSLVALLRLADAEPSAVSEETQPPRAPPPAQALRGGQALHASTTESGGNSSSHVPAPEPLAFAPPPLAAEPVAPGAAETGSFFEASRLKDARPSGFRIHGYVGLGFFVQERSNVERREADGTYADLKTVPFFGAGSSTLYIGAPVYQDVVEVSMAIDYFAVPNVQAGEPDILAAARRQIFVESATLDVRPFALSKRVASWLRHGFRVSGGAFIVPFGLEDQYYHPAPANAFVARPSSMSTGRIYPGTWTDLGVMFSFAPTFRPSRPVSPFQIDLAVVTSDPCTHTRFMDSLFRTQAGVSRVAPCERVLRPDERGNMGPSAVGPAYQPLDVAATFGIMPDNNANKSVVARVRLHPLAAMDVGGSVVWGKHPDLSTASPLLPGEGPVERRQAPSWRVGAHFEWNLDRSFRTAFPLPQVRGELVVGRDEAAPQARATRTLADRRMLGGYVQVSQPLFRRRRTGLPGLLLQYRFDHTDPDRDVPGVRGGVPLRTAFDDAYLYDEAFQSHVFGLRYPVVPHFTLKSEYAIVREDGGRNNQLANDLFSIQAIGDF